MAIAYDTEAYASSGSSTDVAITIDPGAGADTLILIACFHTGAYSITANTLTGSDGVNLTLNQFFSSADTNESVFMLGWIVQDVNLGNYGILTWSLQTAAGEGMGKRIVSFSGVNQVNPIITVGGQVTSSDGAPLAMEAIKVAGGAAFSAILTRATTNNPAPGGSWTELTEDNGVNSGDDSAAYLLSAAAGVETITWTRGTTAGEDDNIVMLLTLRDNASGVTTFDSEQYWIQVGSQASHSLVHYAGPGASAAALFITGTNSSDLDPTTVTYNGVAMTKQCDTGDNGAAPVVWGYTVVGPSNILSSKTIVVTLATTSQTTIRIIILRGINQSSPLVNVATAYDTLTPGSVAVTSVPDAYCLSVVCVGHANKDVSETGTPTEGEEVNSEFFDTTWAYEVATGTTETFNWAWVAAGALAMAAMAFAFAPAPTQVIWYH